MCIRDRCAAVKLTRGGAYVQIKIEISKEDPIQVSGKEWYMFKVLRVYCSEPSFSSPLKQELANMDLGLSFNDENESSVVIIERLPTRGEPDFQSVITDLKLYVFLSEDDKRKLLDRNARSYSTVGEGVTTQLLRD